MEGLEEAVGEVLLLEEVEQEVAEEELHLAEEELYLAEEELHLAVKELYLEEEEGRLLSAADKELEWGKMFREIHLATKVEDRVFSAVEKEE